MNHYLTCTVDEQVDEQIRSRSWTGCVRSPTIKEAIDLLRAMFIDVRDIQLSHVIEN